MPANRETQRTSSHHCALQGVGFDYSSTFPLMRAPSDTQYSSYLGHSRPPEDLKMTLKPLFLIILQVTLYFYFPPVSLSGLLPRA